MLVGQEPPAYHFAGAQTSQIALWNDIPTEPARMNIPRHPINPQPSAMRTREPVNWEVTSGLTDYPRAVARMEDLAQKIAAGRHPETVWLVEHPPIYTAGTSADVADLIDPKRFPVHRTGRGGEFTYHGPGQRVAYIMLDLKRRTPDVRRFVAELENWVITTLGQFNVDGQTRPDRVGVWVPRPQKAPGAEDKIAAIGIRVRRWVTFHGISINVEPDLEHYSGIVPCGIVQHGVTSLVDLGLPVTMDDVDEALKLQFSSCFGPPTPV